MERPFRIVAVNSNTVMLCVMGLKIALEKIARSKLHVRRRQTESALRQSRIASAITAPKLAAIQTLTKPKLGKKESHCRWTTSYSKMRKQSYWRDYKETVLKSPPRRVKFEPYSENSLLAEAS